MKIRIREGNDFDVVWAIKRAGEPEDLSTAINMKLTLVVYGLVIEHSLFTVTDNLLSINIPKEVATVNGDYRLIFEYTLPDAGQPDGDLKCKTDVVPFRIVPFTAKADDIYTINVTSDIAFGFKGDKGDDGDDAYQIWLDLGNEGTYEDFIAYLRQPAVDAGASISELEGEIQVSEGLRVQAESERDLAEATRIQSESERLAAEIIRQSNEGDRIDNEDVRVQNEAERISKENIRQSNETDRVEAEGIRQSNEIDRIKAEGIRVQAEVERQNTIQEAVTATNLANEKANLANTAAQSANEAAGLADTARTELTTAVNTKLGEADDKIEEMDTTLSTYDGRVTQVESDISQLAGDVNLLRDDAMVKMENLVVNGDFSNGEIGWNNLRSTIAVSDANLIITADGSAATSSAKSTDFSGVNSGDKIYICSRMRALNSKASLIRIRMTNASLTNTYGDAGISNPTENQWYPISGIISKDVIFPFYVILLQAEYPATADALNSQHEADNAMAINLTSLFGAGNEPTKEEMDLLISTLGTDYFEGEITIPAQKVMQWQLKMIRQNRNAIVALGGTII